MDERGRDFADHQRDYSGIIVDEGGCDFATNESDISGVLDNAGVGVDGENIDGVCEFLCEVISPTTGEDIQV